MGTALKHRHSNIAVFIPHMGCPNACSFCNQRAISDTAAAPSAEEVRRTLEAACERLPDGDAEIAFFGGSFTAVDRSYMISLLEAAYPFVKSGKVRGIRCSTRPDAVDGEILDILESYGVTSIELGAQSMDDGVLAANRRGHTSAQVEEVSEMIKERGFELGLQMMIGLYRSTPEKDMNTARKLIALAPKTARLYPTVILKNTRLGELFQSGDYIPYSFDTAAELCADMLEMFEAAGIRVIKLGLHASETVEADVLGGFYHPAFREICEGILFRREIERRTEKGGSYAVYVAPNAVSKAMGQKKCNAEYFSAKGIDIRICPDESLKNREIIVKRI
ncbi:MAG: radical SAM protein [Oscillospiraceae bacterium]|nr:radical SAM protein [Oscillospiraceae bacterium]